jgi:hypothetical protein
MIRSLTYARSELLAGLRPRPGGRRPPLAGGTGAQRTVILIGIDGFGRTICARA